MFKNYLQGIEGIATYPMLLLIIFFLFFTSMVIYLWRVDRGLMQKLSEMPLDNKEASASNLKK